MAIPKKIYINWFQGWNNAPEIVKQCLESWKHYNPGWEIIQLDSKNMHEYASQISNYKPIKLQALSDILRIFLLEKGGVWVDATTWCHRPLDDWLDLNQTFFAFSKPTPDKLVASWFLAAEPNSKIVKEWSANTKQYWSKPQTNRPYFWFHFLFNKIYKEDLEFKREWDKIKKIECPVVKDWGPHYFAPYHSHFLNVINEEYFNYLNSKESPVYKLTWARNIESSKKIKELLKTIQ